MNKFLLLLTTLLIGCGSDNTPPAKTDVTIVNVSSDYVLTDDVEDVRFNITQPNITFDLNGHTINTNGDYNAITVRHSNTIIKNGTISGEGYAKGVIIASCITESDGSPLNQQGVGYEAEIYNRCSSGVTIQNMLFENLQTGVYIGDYTYGHLIQHNRFIDMDRMGVYLSPAVTDVTIKNSHFVRNGHRNAEGSGRPRGSISFDSAYGNFIFENKFINTPKYVRRVLNSDYRVPELEFYRNCGEPTFGELPLPRLHGADSNKILNNTFEGVGLVAWFKYREHHQLSNCVGSYPDKSDNNEISGSTLNNIEVFVIDEGNNNMW